MYLTKQTLIDHGACTKGIEYFDRFFPSGADLSKVIMTSHIPESFLHWGYNNLSIDDEERDLYLKRVKVIDSTIIKDSKNILNCNNIISSKDITNSNFIFNSDTVDYSNHIIGSSGIKNCNEVANSSNIFNSDRIIDSKSVTNSKNILLSTFVTDSNSIYESKNVSDSNIIIHCENVSNSYFCADSKGLSNCLFCDQEHDAEFMLFNKKIDEKMYKNICIMFNNIIDFELLLFDSIKDNELNGTPNRYLAQNKQFSTLSNRFLSWIKTLPNYNPNILYNITYIADFKKE